jgi:hypothetical protein
VTGDLVARALVVALAQARAGPGWHELRP